MKGGRGEPGPAGPPGERGPPRERGPQAIPGRAAAKGDKGDKGDTGPRGPKGEKGDIGPQGIKGNTGAQGPRGDKGNTGPQGPMGDTGPKGVKGDLAKADYNLVQTVSFSTNTTHLADVSNTGSVANGDDLRITIRRASSFHISDKDYGMFQALYRDAALSGAYLNVMERPKKSSALCVDVDFRYAIETTKFSNISHAHYIHKLVLKEVEGSFIIDDTQTIESFLFQKPKLKACDKDGFHLVYPSLIITDASRKDVLAALNEEIRRNKESIFAELPINTNKEQNIIDTNVVKAFWATPGSCKMGEMPYAITAKFVVEKDIYIHDDDVLWSNPKVPRQLNERARLAYENARMDMFKSGIDTLLFVGDYDFYDDRLMVRTDNALDTSSGGIVLDDSLPWYDPDECNKAANEEKPKRAKVGKTGNNKDYINSLLQMLSD